MRGAAWLVAALLLLVTPVAAQDASPLRQASLLVYHLSPDPRADEADHDPFSSAQTPTPERLVPAGPSARLPATLVDGVLRASDAPEGDPSSALAHFRELQRLVQARAAAGPPLDLLLGAQLEGNALVVQARSPADPRVGNVTLHLVVVEDGIPYEGASGVRVHRSVARAILDPTGVDLSASPMDVLRRAGLPAGVAPDRVGVVAFLAAPDGEVLQSATWRAGQEGPTRQLVRSVLVERATATWCVPCGPGDEAIALLAAQSAGAASTPQAPRFEPTLLGTAGALGGLAVGLALLRRRPDP